VVAVVVVFEVAVLFVFGADAGRAVVFVSLVMVVVLVVAGCLGSGARVWVWFHGFSFLGLLVLL
jgi:hypothetical protein